LECTLKKNAPSEFNQDSSCNSVVVGAPDDDTNGCGVGQTHVFSASTGALLQTLDDPSASTIDGFGVSVGLSSAVLVVGALRDDTGGADVGQGHVFTGAAEISVLGNGNTIADGDTTPNTIDDTDMGNITFGLTTANRTFTIQNIGELSLNVTTPVAITGAGSAEFSITGQPSNSLTSASSTTFTVLFDPANSGTFTATIGIANDDTDENPYNFDIQGIADPLLPPSQPCPSGAWLRFA
jgi:hypothetical protein